MSTRITVVYRPSKPPRNAWEAATQPRRQMATVADEDLDRLAAVEAQCRLPRSHPRSATVPVILDETGGRGLVRAADIAEIIRDPRSFGE